MPGETTMDALREAAQVALDAASLRAVAARLGMADQDLLDYLAEREGKSGRGQDDR
jgi:hypothetical protein